MPNNLFIVGAGGFGREVYYWAKDINCKGARWNDIKFLDYDNSALDLYNMSHLLLGSEDDYSFTADDYVVCAVADPLRKLQIYSKLNRRGVNITSLIHPTVVLGGNNRIGKGVILCPGVVITTNVIINDYVSINCLTSVGHDVVIGIGSTINGHCDITGNVSIEEGVFIGSSASILPGATVGRYSIVGAGSLVLNKVKENTTVFGVPSKRIE